jgi:RNA polymerase sigma factor (sigma-70 family)
MTSKLEIYIRKLDNEDLTIVENARRIAAALSANPSTVRSYLIAKRQRFGSFHEYLEYRAKKRGITRSAKSNEVQKEKFGTFSAAHDFYATQAGFEDRDDQRNHIAQEKYGFENYNQQRRFVEGKNINEPRQKGMEFISPFELDSIPAESRDFVTPPEQVQEMIQSALEILTPRQAKLIDLIFFKGKTVCQIAEKEGKTHQRIYLTLNKTLRQMRRYLSSID